MKVLEVLAPHQAVYHEEESPKPTGDMVRIKVKRTGVCATDLAIYTGECSFVKSGEITYPCRFGHEYSGVVESIGEGVTQFKVGDRVFSDNAVSCGKCQACREGRYDDCLSVKSLGTVNCWPGCFAEYVYMPERHVHKIPDNLSFDEAALIEPSSMAYAACIEEKLTPETVCAVVGTGAIGLSVAWLLHFLGVKKVIMVGRTDAKLELSKQVGADDVVNSTKVDMAEELKRMTDGVGVDIIFETSGSEAALRACVHAVKRYGVVSVLGFYEKTLDNVPIDFIVLNHITIRGVAGRMTLGDKIADAMKNNPVSMSPAITNHIPFDQCLDFFKNPDMFGKGRIKVMVDFDD